ncbi:MAG: glycosyltransferase [Deltaproteobacteria bacterium]|nr:glycosyltransferase [Deltaproteobacteria bacterium]MBW2066213.1 glycosyltransferase [Deltaproteobacteria bacterium]
MTGNLPGDVKDDRTKDHKGLVSILVCSRDRRKELEELIHSLKTMDTQYAYEIVVVEETDKPLPIEGVNYVSHPVANRGIPYARNLALSHAEGEILVFLDDDCLIHDQWLDKLLAPFEDHSVVGVQGGVTVPPNTNSVGWVEAIVGVPGGNIRRVLEAEGRTVETREISTLNCAYRRWAVDKVGGFESHLKITGEDYVLAKEVCRLGRCLFVPDAMVSHQARGKLGLIWRWFIRRGRADIDVIRATGWTSAKYQWLIRSSLFLKLLVLVLLCFGFPDLAVPFGLVAMLGYITSQYTRYYGPWKKSRISVRPYILLPLVKFVMDLAIDAGRIIELWSKDRTSTSSREDPWSAQG